MAGPGRPQRKQQQQQAAEPTVNTDVTMSDLPVSQQGDGVATGAGSAQPATTESAPPAPSNTEVRHATAGVGALQVNEPDAIADRTAPPTVPSPTPATTSGEQAPAGEQPPPATSPPLDPATLNMVAHMMDQWFSRFAQVPSTQRQMPASSDMPMQSDASTSKLTTRDVQLPPFSGSSDPKAMHIDPSYYLSLIEWVNEARTLLHFSGMQPRQQAFAIFNAMKGPARRLVTLSGVDGSTPDALLDKLVKSIPDHETVFTNQALEMTFSVGTLRKDIETFGMLVSYGEIQTTGRFWFQQLTRKMLAAKSDLLILSASLLNVSLDYRPAEPFQHLIARAVDVVTRLQQEGAIVQKLGNAATGDVGESAGRRGNTPQKRKTTQSETASKRPKHAKGPSYEELAKQYDRCTKCGYHVKPPALATHEASCPGNAEQFKRRMGQVKKMVSAGKADKVNAFGAGKSK